MTQHTPTPWKVIDGDSPYISTQDNTHYVVSTYGCYITKRENKTNADFIVRACNAHDALVDCLERAIRNIPAGPSALRFDMENALKLARGEAEPC